LLCFFFSCCGDLRSLHSFPTRRSSDLSGKWVTGEDGDAFEPSPYQMTLSPFLRECFRQIAKDEEFLRSLHSDFRGSKPPRPPTLDRKSTRLNSSHVKISYAVFCLKKKN